MPSYFYHVKFELYNHPNPGTENNADSGSADSVWLPPPETNIFDDLPAHASRGKAPAAYVFNRSHSYQHESRPARQPAESTSVRDCGTSRAPNKDDRTVEVISERQWRQRTKSLPPPPSSAALTPKITSGDWRFGRVSIETIDLDMATGETSRTGAAAHAAPNLGPSYSGVGSANKAECLILRSKNTEVGWGVVHFYREGEEIPSQIEDVEEEIDDENYTTLCIPAVPAYMTAGDFLGFVGERWRQDISHCRMVMTSKLSRYLVLLKFRSGSRAKLWRKEFDGKVFNTMEVRIPLLRGDAPLTYADLVQPQVCHAVFVKKISFETPALKAEHASSPPAQFSSTMKPFPPPTPSLVELPTCPVCLERMDETNGLMTIPCSHVFHCTCLQNWKGAGCPVCRFTNASETPYDPANPFTQPFGSNVSNLCSVCDCTDDLWICLICGYLGCGRYKGGHAKDHWKETAHCFSLELETQHVWDYAGDMWVHRLIRDKGDGKVVELPGRAVNGHDDEDVVPRAKLDTIALEYTHLMTSQLESQRAYYEEMMNKAVDKAAIASAAAETASRRATEAIERLTLLESEHRTMRDETIPQLERDLDRERKKSSKSETLARNMGKSLQEEKRVNEGLMKRIEHLGADGEAAREEARSAKAEVEELKEMNRDLTMFISGQEKLRELEGEGQLEEGELEGGSVVVAEKKGKGRRKKR